MGARKTTTPVEQDGILLDLFSNILARIPDEHNGARIAASDDFDVMVRGDAGREVIAAYFECQGRQYKLMLGTVDRIRTS